MNLNIYSFCTKINTLDEINLKWRSIIVDTINKKDICIIHQNYHFDANNRIVSLFAIIISWLTVEVIIKKIPYNKTILFPIIFKIKKTMWVIFNQIFLKDNIFGCGPKFHFNSSSTRLLYSKPYLFTFKIFKNYHS